jgi:hypothetical protein
MTNNGLAMITDEFKWGTMLDNVVFQCVDKLFVCFDTITSVTWVSTPTNTTAAVELS